MNPTILFVCLGNSCRSIMAEALARKRFGDRLNVGSAGIRPLGVVQPDTLRVLREIGAPTAGLRSKGLDEVNGEAATRIVNLTNRPLGTILPAALRGKVVDWPVEDPYGGTLEDYRRVRDVIDDLIATRLAGES